VAGVVPSLTTLAVVTKMNEIHKSASLSTVQVKNWQETFSIEEKVDVTNQLETDEQIVNRRQYVQFMVILIKLQKMLVQKLKCLCSRTTTVLSE
jgi:hypothetical protein